MLTDKKRCCVCDVEYNYHVGVEEKREDVCEYCSLIIDDCLLVFEDQEEQNDGTV